MVQHPRRPALIPGAFVRLVLGAGVVLSVLMVVLLWPLAYEFVNVPFNDAGFAVAEWTAAGPLERARMGTDLVANHLPVGMTRAEVMALLGKPSQTRGDLDLYWLGSWSFSPGGYDDAYVRIAYDAEGRLASAEIWGN